MRSEPQRVPIVAIAKHESRFLNCLIRHSRAIPLSIRIRVNHPSAGVVENPVLRIDLTRVGTFNPSFELKRGDVVLTTIVGVSVLCSYCITSPLCALRAIVSHVVD